MKEQEFIERFAATLDDTETEVLSADTVFRGLEAWSSMQALVVIAMIDEDYDVLLSADDLGAAKTLGDLFRIVQERSTS